jgi:hypothetical protein
MFPIDNPSAIPSLPIVPPAGTPGFFTNGNPQTSLPATHVDDWWLNMLQVELQTVIVNAGLTPNKNDNTQLWQALNKAFPPMRAIKLTGDTTFYVDPVNGTDSPAHGQAAGAWRSFQYAANYLVQQVDLAGHQALVQGASPGTYQPFVMAGLCVGSQSPNSVVFRGDVTTPGNCTIVAPAQTLAVAGIDNAQFTIEGFHLSTPNTTNGPCLGATNNSIVYFQNIDFGAAASSHVSTSWGGAQLWAIGGYSISGAAPAHWYAGAGTLIAVQQMPAGGSFACNITAAGLAFSNFALCDLLSQMFVPPSSFSFTGQTGSVTGTRYISRNNSVMAITTGDVNFFPGSVAGVTSAGGIYVPW